MIWGSRHEKPPDARVGQGAGLTALRRRSMLASPEESGCSFQYTVVHCQIPRYRIWLMSEKAHGPEPVFSGPIGFLFPFLRASGIDRAPFVNYPQGEGGVVGSLSFLFQRIYETYDK